MKDAAEHRLQMCSLGIIFLNLLAASLLLVPTEHDHSSEKRKEILAVILVLMNLSIILFVAGKNLLGKSDRLSYILHFHIIRFAERCCKAGSNFKFCEGSLLTVLFHMLQQA